MVELVVLVALLTLVVAVWVVGGSVRTSSYPVHEVENLLEFGQLLL